MVDPFCSHFRFFFSVHPTILSDPFFQIFLSEKTSSKTTLSPLEGHHHTASLIKYHKLCHKIFVYKTMLLVTERASHLDAAAAGPHHHHHHHRDARHKP